MTTTSSSTSKRNVRRAGAALFSETTTPQQPVASTKPSKKVVFTIPVDDVSDVGAQKQKKASGVVLTPPTPASSRISAKAWNALSKAFLKQDDKFEVSEEDLTAAKQELLTFWGFPAGFVQEHSKDLHLQQLPGSPSTVDDQGRVSGSLGNFRVEGWVNRKDDWKKEDIAKIVAAMQPPKAAGHITPHGDFFARNDIKDSARAEITARLFDVLKNWTTVSDADVAWAKKLLTKGYDIKGTIVITPFAEGKSAVDAEQRIRGQVTTEKGAEPRNFMLDLDAAVYLVLPSGYVVE